MFSKPNGSRINRAIEQRNGEFPKAWHNLGVALARRGDLEQAATALRKAQASNAVIYTIALIDPLSRDANPALLQELAQASGGASFRRDDPRGIADAFARVGRHIRHVYTLGYAPIEAARDGAFRRVRVVVTAPAGRRFVARTRSGYLAGSPPP